MIIPLAGGSVNAHQKFQAQLGDELYDFELNYINASGQWAMNIYLRGLLLAAGAMLEPNCDVTAHHNLGIGKMVFVGREATLDNLGVANSLHWIGS